MIRFNYIGEWCHICVLLSLAVGLPVLLVTIILLIERLPEAYIKRIEFFGTHSLELYIVHEFIFNAYEISMSNNWEFFFLLVSFSVSILIAYFCKIGIERIKSLFL
jgi:peptidoglycan/LPS O-acetylase OafA/YrhL